MNVRRDTRDAEVSDLGDLIASDAEPDVSIGDPDTDGSSGDPDTDASSGDPDTDASSGDPDTSDSDPDTSISDDADTLAIGEDGDAVIGPPADTTNDDLPETSVCGCPEGLWCDDSGACVDHVCGDGRLDGPEMCDPPGSCPTSCDDGQPCTEDALVGDAATCTAHCTHTAISDCRGGDLCCPDGCNASSDADCSPRCGDGVVSPPEKCDPPGSCPIACNDGDACTVDRLFGSASTCSANCSYLPIVACAPGDGCCPPGCHALNDTDCAPACGNGVVELPEACDPPGSCPTTCNDNNACTIDTMVGVASQCTRRCERSAVTICRNSDGCCPAGCNAVNDNDCRASCGNSVVEPGETCDPPGSCPTSCNDGNVCTRDTLVGSSASCTRACSSTAITACANNDGCCPAGCNAKNDNNCAPVCGNGVVESGETCDPPGSCPTSCNDGNVCTTDTATGSAASCTRACSSTPITVCSGSDGCCPAGCNANNDANCAPVCGNAVLESGETCDPLSTCPTSCSDGDSCTVDTVVGTACARQCTFNPVTTCAGGDACCPSTCSAANDYDCAGDCGECVLDCTNDATWPAAWRYYEDRVLTLVNQRRAAGATCGGVAYPPAAPLAADTRLREAARCHTLDMAENNFVAHTGSNGSTLVERLAAAGFAYQSAAENLGAGALTPEAVVDAWMLSAGHCTNVMAGHLTLLGVGYIARDDTVYERFWTQDFGTPAN